MPLTLDLSGDFAVFDAAQPVTYTRRNPDGTAAATYSPVSALRESATAGPAGVGPGAQAVATSARWRINAPDVPLPPRSGDVFVTASGARWEVLDCETPPLGAPYACNCKRVA